MLLMIWVKMETKLISLFLYGHEIHHNITKVRQKEGRIPPILIVPSMKCSSILKENKMEINAEHESNFKKIISISGNNFLMARFSKGLGTYTASCNLEIPMQLPLNLYWCPGCILVSLFDYPMSLELKMHFCTCPVPLVWTVKYLIWQSVRFVFLTKQKLRIYTF